MDLYLQREPYKWVCFYRESLTNESVLTKKALQMGLFLQRRPLQMGPYIFKTFFWDVFFFLLLLFYSLPKNASLQMGMVWYKTWNPLEWVPDLFCIWSSNPWKWVGVFWMGCRLLSNHNSSFKYPHPPAIKQHFREYTLTHSMMTLYAFVWYVKKCH